MGAPLEAEISGFKSIDHARLRLGRITVLIGPPAGGKSNILEALALHTYAVRSALTYDILGYPSADHIPPLDLLVRLSRCEDLLNRISHYSDFKIKLSNIEVNGYCEKPFILKLNININNKIEITENARIEGASRWRPIPKRLLQQRSDNKFQELINFFLSLIEFSEEEKTQVTSESIRIISELPPRLDITVYDSRLYAFDRFGILHFIMHGQTGLKYPDYPHELALNLGTILYTKDKLLEILNNIINKISGLEVRPLATGELAFFDGSRDVGSASVSDTILRLLYGLAGMLDSSEMNGEATVPLSDSQGKASFNIRVKPIVLLEEPESHMYPIAFTFLLDLLRREFPRESRIVVTTHSSRLVDEIIEKFMDVDGGLEVYYVDRGGKRVTEVLRLDYRRLLEDGITVGDLVDQEDVAENFKEYFIK